MKLWERLVKPLSQRLEKKMGKKIKKFELKKYLDIFRLVQPSACEACRFLSFSF
jgi:hypothetical protein